MFSLFLYWGKHLSQKPMGLLKLIHLQLTGFFFFWYEFNMLGKQPPAMGKAVAFLFPSSSEEEVYTQRLLLNVK